MDIKKENKYGSNYFKIWKKNSRITCSCSSCDAFVNIGVAVDTSQK